MQRNEARIRGVAGTVRTALLASSAMGKMERGRRTLAALNRIEGRDAVLGSRESGGDKTTGEMRRCARSAAVTMMGSIPDQALGS